MTGFVESILDHDTPLGFIIYDPETEMGLWYRENESCLREVGWDDFLVEGGEGARCFSARSLIDILSHRELHEDDYVRFDVISTAEASAIYQFVREGVGWDNVWIIPSVEHSVLDEKTDKMVLGDKDGEYFAYSFKLERNSMFSNEFFNNQYEFEEK
jgi:hypothetical protein